MPVTRGNVELAQYMAEVTFELGQEAWVWMSASGMGMDLGAQATASVLGEKVHIPLSSRVSSALIY